MQARLIFGPSALKAIGKESALLVVKTAIVKVVGTVGALFAMHRLAYTRVTVFAKIVINRTLYYTTLFQYTHPLTQSIVP